MQLPEIGTNNDVPDWDQGGISANGLTFYYPKSLIPAIDTVSLTINKGETVAIVGENGSGKTTLVKLLCGLYKPDSGQVVIGGQDTIITNDAALFLTTSAVFQNYVRYHQLSLEENVKISEYNSIRDVVPALESAEIIYKDNFTFPRGIETILSREFDGTEISTGQWQRVAMAKGVYRQHLFIILDEPTAAIDPLEETRIYKQFAKIAKEKTTLLVTHRLGSARIADKIIVMEHGKISEIGSHHELLKNGKKYAQMWNAQAYWYQ